MKAVLSHFGLTAMACAHAVFAFEPEVCVRVVAFVAGKVGHHAFSGHILVAVVASIRGDEVLLLGGEVVAVEADHAHCTHAVYELVAVTGSAVGGGHMHCMHFAVVAVVAVDVFHKDMTCVPKGTAEGDGALGSLAVMAIDAFFPRGFSTVGLFNILFAFHIVAHEQLVALYDTHFMAGLAGQQIVTAFLPRVIAFCGQVAHCAEGWVVVHVFKILPTRNASDGAECEDKRYDT